MNRTTRTLFLTLLAAATLFALPGVASAHGLGADAKLKDGRVHVEGYFDDDTAAADARVWVEDGEKRRVAEGKMDGKGRWSFPAPAPGKYRVTVDAGGGHRAAVTVTVPAAADAARPPSTGQGSAEGDAVRVSEGKSREEFTRVPWLRLGAGLALIGTLAVAIPLLLRAARRKATPAPGEKAA